MTYFVEHPCGCQSISAVLFGGRPDGSQAGKQPGLAGPSHQNALGLLCLRSKNASAKLRGGNGGQINKTTV